MLDNNVLHISVYVLDDCILYSVIARIFDKLLFIAKNEVLSDMPTVPDSEAVPSVPEKMF